MDFGNIYFDTMLQVWIQSLGSCMKEYCSNFNSLGVDGWLLSEVSDDILQSVLGVDKVSARHTIMDQLKALMGQSKKHTAVKCALNSSHGSVQPKIRMPDTEILTMSRDTLSCTLVDIFMHYDQDQSGDLNIHKVQYS